jgi:hypothetical protein
MNRNVTLLIAFALLLGAPWLSPSSTAKADDDETRTKTTIHEKRMGDPDLDDDATIIRKKKVVKKGHGHHHHDDDDDVTVTRKKSVTTTEHEE